MAKRNRRWLGVMTTFALAGILLLVAKFYTLSWEVKTWNTKHYRNICGDISDEMERGSFNWEKIAKNNRATPIQRTFSAKNDDKREKIAIILPYRDRLQQLWQFLEYMHPIWQGHNLNYWVYVIEQYGDNLFNRGKLLNIGFQVALKDQDYDCFIFHDVDILPENSICSYACHSNTTEVNHLSAFLEKYGYKNRNYKIRCPPKEYPYNEIHNVGGILMMQREQFHRINGFSNLFWGWGGEDDDLYLRIWRKGLSVYENPKCTFCMMKHSHSEENHVKHRLLNISFLIQDEEGLNSLKYEVLSKRLTGLYTKVVVDVGLPSKELLGNFKRMKGKEHCDGRVLLDNQRLLV